MSLERLDSFFLSSKLEGSPRSEIKHQKTYMITATCFPSKEKFDPTLYEKSESFTTEPFKTSIFGKKLIIFSDDPTLLADTFTPTFSNPITKPLCEFIYKEIHNAYIAKYGIYSLSTPHEHLHFYFSRPFKSFDLFDD